MLEDAPYTINHLMDVDIITSVNIYLDGQKSTLAWKLGDESGTNTKTKITLFPSMDLGLRVEIIALKPFILEAA